MAVRRPGRGRQVENPVSPGTADPYNYTASKTMAGLHDSSPVNPDLSAQAAKIQALAEAQNKPAVKPDASVSCDAQHYIEDAWAEPRRNSTSPYNEGAFYSDNARTDKNFPG